MNEVSSDTSLASGEATSSSEAEGVWPYLGWLKNRSTLSIIDQGIVSATSLLTTIIVGRYCGSAGLGLFALGYSLLVLASGTQTSLVSTPYTVFRTRSGDRLSPAHHAGGALAGAVFLSAMLTLAAFAAASVITFTSQPAAVKSLAWALTVAVPCFLAREFARRFDFAWLDMRSAVLLDGGVALVQVTMLITFAVRGELTGATAILLIAFACGAMVATWGLRQRQDFVVARHLIPASLKHDWRFGRWLFADHVICITQLYVMHWILTFFMSPSATGILAACATISALANPFLQGIGNYLSPRFAETVSHGSARETKHLYWRTTSILFVGVTVFTAIAVLFGEKLLWLLYHDPAYAKYGLVVGLLALRMVFAIPTVAADHAMVAMESPRGTAIATLAGLIATVALAIPLVTFYAITGAALAMLLGTAVESLVVLLVFVRCWRQWDWSRAAGRGQQRMAQEDAVSSVAGADA